MSKGKTFEESLRASFIVVKGFFVEKDNRGLIEGAIDPIIGSTWVDEQTPTEAP